MNDFVLSIFPNDSATAITTSVFVGVWVVAFFNLRLGWTLSGLVVPGYLVPLLIIHPVSAIVILVEAIVTYWIVLALSENLPSRYWSSLFGRDRFCAIVAISILVRVTMEGFLFPISGDLVNEWFNLNIDHGRQLHSYGLIIVSLIANYFWKPGLRRGIGPLMITIAITYVVVRHVLIKWTNFNLGGLQFLYEDIASSLLASPKTYIVLLTTAYIASWMNLRYAWEFNGILIPALLALQWHTPLKLVSTFAEALFILAVAKVLLASPILRGASMQGARKILLFFNIAFVFRLILAWIVPLFFEEAKVSDFHGFGYLLATLLAIRFYDKNQVLRITRATLQVSIVGGLCGSVIGFLLLSLPIGFAAPVLEESSFDHVQGSLVEVIRRDKPTLYSAETRVMKLTGRELADFTDGLDSLLRYLQSSASRHLSDAQLHLSQVGYRVQFVEDGRYLYIRSEGSRSRDIFVLDTQNLNGIAVEVPNPLGEPYTLESGLSIFLACQGGAISINSDVTLTNREKSFFTAFRQIIGRNRTLRIRGPKGTKDSSLHLSKGIPKGLQARDLRQLLGRFSTQWSATSKGVLARRWDRQAELRLSNQSRTRLLARLMVSNAEDGKSQVDVETGSLQRWLLDRKESIVKAGTNIYRTPRPEELFYLDAEVLEPLIRYAWSNQSTSWEKLQIAAAAANVMDYKVSLFKDENSKREYLVLYEDGDSNRHWGTYVFSRDLTHQFIWEVPRPLYERQSFEFAASSFEATGGLGFFCTGAHVRANTDGSSDVARQSNKYSMFTLVHQAALRELGDAPALFVQSRAIKDPVDVDLILATDRGARSEEELTPLKRQLYREVSAKRSAQFVDGSVDTAGYELGRTVQLQSLRQSQNKEFMGIWLSASLRSLHRQQTEATVIAELFSTLGIPTIEQELADFVLSRSSHLAVLNDQPALMHELRKFAESRDIVVLHQLKNKWPDAKLVHLVDSHTKVGFLLVLNPEDKVVLLMRTTGTLNQTAKRCFRVERSTIADFERSHALWLLSEEAP